MKIILESKEKEKMHLLVSGSRSLTDSIQVKEVLNSKCNPGFMIWFYRHVTLISGNASGVDKISIDWANENNFSVKLFHPDWKKYGKAAGPIRNSEMINLADFVLIIWDGKSKGSLDVIEKCRKLGKPCEVVVLG